MMIEDLKIKQELMEDLLSRISGKGAKVREAAIEALAVSTEDDDWRPNELIRQGGVDIIKNLLYEKNPHIVISALDIIIAIAASGEEETLISEGMIASLDTMQNEENPVIQKKVREALSIIQPEVEEIVTTKPQDDY
jgi:predicted XRE-type DNA-binding protein